MRTVAIVAVVAQLAGASPWSDALDALRAGRDQDARARLEAVGRDASVAPEVRAHAWSWAGQIAARRGALDAARGDFQQARRAAPASFDGRMAAVHEGEVAMRARRWGDAERALAAVERDPDPVIVAYASARLRAVRTRVRRRAVRCGEVALLALALVALAVRAARSRRGARARSFGRALLVTEAAALAGAAAVPRWFTSLAASGWMAFAIPASVGVALLWATRDPAPSRARAALTLAATAVVLAAGLHLALDLTWLSIEDPMP